MTARKIAAGILTGIAAGAVISLMVSKNKKSGMKKKLQQKGSDISEDLKGKFNEFVDRVEHKFQSILH
jgi:hypothetical protein